MSFKNKLLVICIFFALSGCKKFITDLDNPSTQLVTNSVFSSDATANGAISGLYTTMISPSGGWASGSSASITYNCGLSADEYINWAVSSVNTVQFYSNNLAPTNSVTTSNLWNSAYNIIYQANSIISGLSASSGVSVSVKNQILGEAKFIRAFSHFYLVNLFGDVPVVTSTDYSTNNSIVRSPKADVYKQIISDLIDAQTLLPSDYSFANNEKVRPNKWAATALLARVYLYTGDYAKAEAQATSVIGSGQYSLVSNLNSVFLKNSAEAIWQLKPTSTTINTNEGNLFIVTTSPSSTNSVVTLSNALFTSFETGDARKTFWTHDTTISGNLHHYAFKYKVFSGATLSEYSMVLRLPEQYLIRAEARTQQNNINGAQSDLNVIRTRAGLANTTASTNASLMTAITHERQVEYFAEWGHRWFDLKRLGLVDGIMQNITPTKGGTWQSYQQLYPIPQADRDKNSNLTQNTGY